MAAPSTPIRAITNSLSLRSTPPVPPASQTYEPLVKAVLRHRLIFRIFTFSALFTWGSVVVNGVWVQGGVTKLGLVGTLLSSVRPTGLLLATATWVLGVLPILILRKAYLTATPSVASSPSKAIQSALNKTSTLPALIAYSVASVIFMILHVFTYSAYGPIPDTNPGLSLFVKSKKHPYYFNGRTLYIILSQISLALLYLCRNIMLDRFTVRWTASLLGADVQTYRLAKALISGVTMILLSVISLIAHTALFAFSRSILLPIIYRVPLVSRLLRPFMAHFLRGPLSFTLLFRNWDVIKRACVLGLFTVLNWEFGEAVFDGYVAEPLAVSQFTPDPSLALVSGVSSPSSYIQHFAFSELRALATDSSPNGATRRSALFADQKYNPTIWTSFVRTALMILERDYQAFLRRGAPEPKPASVASVPQLDKKEGPKIPSTPLVKTNVLKMPIRNSPLKTVENNVAVDGIASTALVEPGASHLPDLFRSVMTPPPPTPKPKAEESPKAPPPHATTSFTGRGVQWLMFEVDKAVDTWAPIWVHEARSRVADWWTRERLSRAVEGSLPNRKLDILAIETLCGFVCASLDEDRYGVVQRDMPRILESFVSFLLAMEEYQVQLNTSFATEHPQALVPEELAKLSVKELAELERAQEEMAKAGEVLREVGDVLKGSLVQITQVFGHRLAAFKFPPRIESKLKAL